MTFNEFAKKAINLIHKPRQESDYLKEVTRLLNAYIALCSQLDEPIIAKKQFTHGPKMSMHGPWESVCVNIKGILLDFIHGRTLSASFHFHKSFFDEQSIFGGHLPSVLLDLKEGDVFFRVRNKTHGIPFKKEELYHIPFSKRHLVQNLRYSISGLPSLYFGSDTYTCWEELNRPEFSKVAFCGFKLKKPLTLLDLRIPSIKESYTEEEKVGFIVRLPIILAVTRTVLYKDAPFKPEYILSQILSQVAQEQAYIDDRTFRGIAFSSSKIDYKNNSPSAFYNVFLPTIYHSQNDVSPIIDEYFDVSEPIEWEVLQALSEGVISGGNAVNFPKGKELSLDGNNATDYNMTRWGMIDSAIKNYLS